MSSKKKKGLSGKFAVFITVLLLVCTAIFLNNKFSSGSLRKLSYWIFNGVHTDASESSISFDANRLNRFETLNGNLCLISPERLSAFKLSGKATLNQPVLLRSPAVKVSKSRFVAYDLGGLNFYVANSNRLLFEGTCESQILNANQNDTGYFSIVTDDADCKSLLTIYNPKFDVIYKYHSAEKYIFDAAVSPSGKVCAIACYGTANGNFESSVLLGKTEQKEFYSTISLGSSMPLEISYPSENKVIIVCNDRTVICNSDGTLLSEVSYNGLPVKYFSTAHTKHTVLLLDNYQNGGNTQLLLIKNNGDSATLDIEDDVYSVSASSGYISLQFSDKCVIYKNDLTVYSEVFIPASVNRCVVNNDGSFLAISENFATLYVK